MDWASDQLLFINPRGEKRLVVVVAAEGHSGEETRRRRGKPVHTTVVWNDEHVQVTTAGPIWTAGSFETFPSSPEAAYFCLRTGWGRRLLVDLHGMTLVEQSALSEDVLALVVAEERKAALDALRSLVPVIQSGHADWSQRRRIEGALVVVMAHRISEAASLLRQLESARRAESWSSCPVLGARWHGGHEVVRSLARLALRFIGEEPSPGGNYTFSARLPGAPHDEAAVASAATPSGAWDLAKTTTPGSTGEAVLSDLGPPDFIRRQSKKVDEYYVWSEIWDYDGPLTTTRITWSFPEASRREIADQPRHVARVEELAAWQEPDRLLSILGFTS
jgi:hypothetical protein